MVVDLHIIPRDGKWAVRAGTSHNDRSLHDFQEQALQEAQKHALQSGGSIIVYGKDGSVRERHTLPQNSFPDLEERGDAQA